MSHIVEIKTQVRDPLAAALAAGRLQLPAPREGRFRLFSTEVEGLGVQLPQWRYPVVCQLQSGQIAFDNYEGRWGDPAHLDRFLQAYAVEKTKIEARRQGHSVSECSLDDGSIKLLVEIGGAA